MALSNDQSTYLPQALCLGLWKPSLLSLKNEAEHESAYLMVNLRYIYIHFRHRGVSKNRGVSPKMDDLFHGKPYCLMDDLGGNSPTNFWKPPYIFGNTHYLPYTSTIHVYVNICTYPMDPLWDRFSPGHLYRSAGQSLHPWHCHWWKHLLCSQTALYWWKGERCLGRRWLVLGGVSELLWVGGWCSWLFRGMMCHGGTKWNIIEL